MCDSVGANTPLCARMRVATAELALNFDDLAQARRALLSAQSSAKGLSDPGLPLLMTLTEALIQAQMEPGPAALAAAKRRLIDVAGLA